MGHLDVALDDDARSADGIAGHQELLHLARLVEVHVADGRDVAGEVDEGADAEEAAALVDHEVVVELLDFAAEDEAHRLLAVLGGVDGEGARADEALHGRVAEGGLLVHEVLAMDDAHDAAVALDRQGARASVEAIMSNASETRML